MSLAPDPETDRNVKYGDAPPCPAERAEAADAYHSYQRAREAFLLAAEALGAAALDAGIVDAGPRYPAAKEVADFIACVSESVGDLIDADALAELKKTGRC